MKTAFMLMARYDGLPVIPIDVICRDFFSHLTPEKFLRKIAAGEIALPIVDGGIEVETLALYINERARIARQELAEAQEAQEQFSKSLAAALAEPLPRVTIYFIESGGHVKIGMTAGDVRQRLSTLATSHYAKLTLLATIPDAPASLEFELHQRFAQDRIRGEWFQLSDEICAYLDKIRAPK